MNSIPMITTVADLQRKYRTLADKVRATSEPMVVVNNGVPDVVLMSPSAYNSQAERLKELEEDYLLRIKAEAIEEYKNGKTIRLKKGQKLSDLLK